MRKRLLTATLALMLLSSPALALTLNEARAQGRVGETLNGYLAPLKQDAQTLALVKQINAARSEATSNWRTTIICRWMRWRKWPDRNWSPAHSRENMCRGLTVNGCANS